MSYFEIGKPLLILIQGLHTLKNIVKQTIMVISCQYFAALYKHFSTIMHL